MFYGADVNAQGVVTTPEGQYVGTWTDGPDGEYSRFIFSQEIIDSYIHEIAEVPLGVATYAVRGCECGRFKFITDGSSEEFAVPHIEAGAKYHDAVTIYWCPNAYWFLRHDRDDIIGYLRDQTRVNDISDGGRWYASSDWLRNIRQTYIYRCVLVDHFLLIPHPRYRGITIPYGTLAGDYMCELVLRGGEMHWLVGYLHNMEAARHIPEGYTLTEYSKKIQWCDESRGGSSILAYTRYKNHILLTVRRSHLEDVAEVFENYVISIFPRRHIPPRVLYNRGERVVLPTGTSWVVGDTKFYGDGVITNTPSTAQKIINALRIAK